MAIKKISVVSISDEVLDQMKKQIINGEWEPGIKIPGEVELTNLFGVSRVTIREAIHRLCGMGVLTVRRGEGTFVAEILPKDYFSILLPVLMIEKDNIADILEFRAVLETQTAGIAAERATNEDIYALEQILMEMNNKVGNYKEFAVEDLNFHTALAIATHNSVIVKVNAIIHEMLQEAMDKIVKTSGFEGGLKYHKKILEAIIKRDRILAMDIMNEHIRDTVKVMEKNSK